MSRTLELATIDRALRLIRDKRHWTRYAVTRRPNGACCKPVDDRAVRYCAFGALVRAATELSGSCDRRLIEATERMVLSANGCAPNTRLAALNDHHGHAAVIKAFEQTLKSH
jgi:hypothetical protein